MHFFQERGLSERAACRLVQLPRTTLRYTSCASAEGVALIERLRPLKVKQPRLGYRMATHQLRRQTGEQINPKRVYRLWKTEGFAVKPRVKKKRLKGPKQERPETATHPNHVWTVDFIEDQLVTGRKLRILTVTDEFTRESVGIEVDLRLPAEKVKQTLAQTIANRGSPGYLRCDNGPEFVALPLRGFLLQSGVKTQYIEPARAPQVPSPVAERLCRELPRAVARGVPQSGGVLDALGCEGAHPNLAEMVQRGAATQ